jgi:hypothetical protein
VFLQPGSDGPIVTPTFPHFTRPFPALRGLWKTFCVCNSWHSSDLLAESRMAQIKFGTDGWRAVIAEDFTFANVARVAQATADFWKSEARNQNSEIFWTET